MFTRLSCWSQIAPRSYVRFMLCFALPDEDRARSVIHLRAALARLCARQPDLAGALRVYGWFDSSAVWLQSGSPGDTISIHVHDVSEEPAFEGADTFEWLEREGFAPSRFVGSALRIPEETIGEVPIPAVAVRIHFVKGGLLLAVYFHHSLGDGWCMDKFLRCFAAETRGESIEQPINHILTFPDHSDHSDHPPTNGASLMHRHTYPLASWETQLHSVQEFSLMPGLEGPSQVIQLPGGTPLANVKDVVGKIFVITTSDVARLKQLVAEKKRQSSGANGKTGHRRKLPSAYTVLAALVWAHMTEARIKRGGYHAPSEAHELPGRLVTPVDWRPRAFPGSTAKYFGNATTQGVTDVPTHELRRAAGANNESDEEDVEESIMAQDADEALARIVGSIESAIHQVDEHYVRRRTELFDSVRDVRKIGLAVDVRAPQNLHFNTWRRFGGGAQWQLVDSPDGSHGKAPRLQKPAAMRRIQTAWNLGGALVMPAQNEDDPYEICITLEAEAMDALCADKRWMRWVSRVVS